MSASTTACWSVPLFPHPGEDRESPTLETFLSNATYYGELDVDGTFAALTVRTDLGHRDALQRRAGGAMMLQLIALTSTLLVNALPDIEVAGVTCVSRCALDRSRNDEPRLTVHGARRWPVRLDADSVPRMWRIGLESLTVFRVD